MSGKLDVKQIMIIKDIHSQPGHKYLFSEMQFSWEDSRLECELYGGWLVQINSRTEYNCLMRHGLKEEILEWYWTDGNDVADSGVWTHARDNSEMSFFPPKIRCNCQWQGQESCSANGNAFILYIGDNLQYRGNYCDNPISKEHNLICEAPIE